FLEQVQVEQFAGSGGGQIETVQEQRISDGQVLSGKVRVESGYASQCPSALDQCVARPLFGFVADLAAKEGFRVATAGGQLHIELDHVHQLANSCPLEWIGRKQ